MDPATCLHQCGVLSCRIGSNSRILSSRIRFGAQSLSFARDSRVLYKFCYLKRRKAVLTINAADRELPSSQEQIDNEESTAPVNFTDESDVTTVKNGEILVGDSLLSADVGMQNGKEAKVFEDMHDQEKGELNSELEDEFGVDKSKSTCKQRKQDIQQKESAKDSPLTSPKLQKSSRFISASFFSFNVKGEEFTLASVFYALIASVRKQAAKLVLGALFIGMGATFLTNRAEMNSRLLHQLYVTPGMEEVTSTAREIRNHPRRSKKFHEDLREINEEAYFLDILWLLLASVVFAPIFQKIPGGSPVFGYLAAGILIGPYGLSIKPHVHGMKAIAEFGVVFLLFTIGLELSVERLSSMKKYIFGLGSAQVLATAAAVGCISHLVVGLPGPAAIVIGNGLALSSTAVVLQLLEARGERTSWHGRAAFSVLLFQDLAVVVLLILIPLISPNSSKGGVGFKAIAEALGMNAVKAIVATTTIIAGGRLIDSSEKIKKKISGGFQVGKRKMKT